MATPPNISLARSLTRPLNLLWLAALGILTALLTLLSIAIKNNPHTQAMKQLFRLPRIAGKSLAC